MTCNYKCHVKPKSTAVQDSPWFTMFWNVQGNIAKWRKKEGDKVSAGDILCEIETVHEPFLSLEWGFICNCVEFK